MALAAAPRAPLSYRTVTPGALSLPAAAQADPAPPLGCGPPRSGQPPLQPLPLPPENGSGHAGVCGGI